MFPYRDKTNTLSADELVVSESLTEHLQYL